MFERARPRRNAISAAIVTSSVACLVDFHCMPRRFTPGFEKRLSRGSLLITYAAFGAGLAASRLIRPARKDRGS